MPACVDVGSTAATLPASSFAQALGDAGLHAIEQGVEVHAATLAGKTFLKARDATVAALLLEQLGARGTAQRRLAALGRKIERRAGVQIQRPAHGLGVDERLGMWRQPARISMGAVPDSSSRTVGSASLNSSTPVRCL